MTPHAATRWLLLRLPLEVGRKRSTGRPCNNGCVACRTDPVQLGAIEFSASVAERDVLLTDFEPLLARSLPRLVHELRSRDARSITLVTNGRLCLYPEISRRLAHAGLDRVVVKLFGPEASSHDAHTRVPGSFEQARAGVAELEKAGLAVSTVTLAAGDDLARALAQRTAQPLPETSHVGRSCYDVLEPLEPHGATPAGNWIERFLPMIHIPTGNHCNNQCIYCNVEGGPGEPLYPAPQIDALLDHAARSYLPARSGTPTIDFIGGEPTLRPDLPRLISRARALGFAQVTICTNGLRLAEPGFLPRLVSAGLTGVRLSLHDHRAQVASELAGNASAGPPLLAAAELLLGQRELQVHIYRLLLARTVDAIGDYLHWISDRRRPDLCLDVALGLPSPRGRMVHSLDLYPTLESLRPTVSKAVGICQKLELELCVHHAPGCIVPGMPEMAAVLQTRTLRIDAESDRITPVSFEGDTRHPARCAPCAARDRCYGLANGYFATDPEAAERWPEPLAPEEPAPPSASPPPRQSPRQSPRQAPAQSPRPPGTRTAPPTATSKMPSWLPPGARILLLNPPVADTIEAEEQDLLTCTPPIGLLRAASWFRDRGSEVRWLDCLRDPALNGTLRRHVRAELACGNDPDEPLTKSIFHFGLDQAALTRRLEQEPEPEVIGIGATFTWQLAAIADAVAACRTVFPTARLVVGGNAARLVGDEVRRLGTDVWVAEELPDGAFVPTAIDLLAATPSTDYPSLVRGCPHHCEYCVTPHLSGGRVVARDPEEVFAEMKARSATLGVRRFVFFDDFIHFQQSRHLDPLLDMVIADRSGLRVELPLGLSSGMVDERLATRLRAAGLEHAIVALETTSAERGREMNRPHATGEFLRAAAILRDHGYRGDTLRAFYLIGLPGQTTTEILRAIAFLYSLEITPSLTTYALTPGTGDWPRYRPLVSSRTLGELTPTLWPFAHAGMRAAELDGLQRLFHEKHRALSQIDDEPPLGCTPEEKRLWEQLQRIVANDEHRLDRI